MPEVGITVSDAVISLRILAAATSMAQARAQTEPVEQTIRERLGTLVFGEEADDLEDAVVRLLCQRRLTLATAESVTCGQVAARLGRVPGVSAWFRGGIVAYQDRAKSDLLGVPADLIREHGAVERPPVAEAMAVGCRARLGTDLAISTTGLAGPDGATTEKPVGLVYAALAHGDGVRVIPYNWSGTRSEIQSRAARLALNLVRLQLLKSN